MLDRGLKDASFLSSIVLNEIATHSNVHSTLVGILNRAMNERDEAQRESSRYREALASAEADRHPCTALHTRIAELQRRIGEQHGFTLTSCARCNRDLIATTEDNDELNNAMDICSPCTDEMNREHQTAAIKDAEKVLLDMENLIDHDGVIGNDFYQAAAAVRTALQPTIKERVQAL